MRVRHIPVGPAVSQTVSIKTFVGGVAILRGPKRTGSASRILRSQVSAPVLIAGTTGRPIVHPDRTDRQLIGVLSLTLEIVFRTISSALGILVASDL